MSFSRRDFHAIGGGRVYFGHGRPARLTPLAAGATIDGYRANMLPSQKEVWDWQLWMAGLGPKYTGNKAHTEFVEFLAARLKE